jgi:putative ABC transport system permease protein
VKGVPVPVSYRDLLDWKAQQTVFETMGVYFRSGYTLAGAGGPQSLDSARMSAEAFAALRIKPALGRVFSAEDERPDAPSVVILSYGLWQRQFGGDRGILNRPITVGGDIVVGVMPPGFAFPSEVSLWELPETWRTRNAVRNRTSRIGQALGRLQPGVTLEQASAALKTIASRLEQQYPETNKNVAVRVERLLDSQIGDVRRALWVLLGGAGLVLLIACANVAGLLLARAVAREGEMAVRAALGAGRRRLLQQMLTESVLLATIGAAAGVALAAWSLRLVMALAQGRIPRVAEISLDGGVLGFSVAIALGTGVCFGLAPAWYASRREIRSALTDAADRVTRRARLRHGLVVAQVTLTMMLLVGAGLLFRSFRELLAVNSGFAHDEVLTFGWGLPERRYSLEQQLAMYERLLAELRALPGVESASIASQIPLDLDDANILNRRGHAETRFIVEGKPDPPPDERPTVEMRFIAPDYFHVMGIPLLRGRDFTAHDDREHLRGSPRENDRSAAMNVAISMRRPRDGTGPTRIPSASGSGCLRGRGRGTRS